jgi:kinesin family protein 20
MNAKLDILTRLQAAKTPRRGVSPLSPSSDLTLSPNYDDSDEDELDEGDETEREDTRLGEEEEEEEGDSGEVAEMLLADQRGQARVSTSLKFTPSRRPVADGFDSSRSQDSMSPLAARVNVHLKITSPLAASPSVQRTSPSPPPGRVEEDQEAEESEDDQEISRDSSDIREVEPNSTMNTEAEMEGSETIYTETDRSIEEDGTIGELSWVSKDGGEEGEEDFSASFVDTTTATEDQQSEHSEEEDTVEADEEEEEPEADEDVASPAPRSASTMRSVWPQLQTPNNYEKENVVPTKMDDGPSRDVDEFGYDEEKSLIIETGSKSGKKKR